MAKNNKIPKCPPLRFPQFSDEWQQTTLGEIAEITSGYSGEQEQMETPYRVSRIETISSGVIDIERVGFVSYDAKLVAYKLSLGDILFSNINSIEHIGKSAIVSRPIDLYHGMNLLRLKAINIDPYVLYYHLQRDVVRNRFRSIANKAVSQASINQTILGKEPVLLAPTLAEQEKIASFLSLIDERIQSCSETIKERKREKAALLNQLFSQKLRLPQFSDEWQQTMLGEIAEILNSRRKPITSSDRVRGDYPYYGASGIIDYVNEYIFDEQLLLIGEDGAKWGKDEKTAFIVNGRCWVNNHAHVLRFQNYPTYKLIEAFFFSLNLKPFVTGDAPPKLTLENLKSILIHFPSLAEQEKIADFLSLIDERIEVEEELLEQYERQKRYLLKQMFI